MDEGKTNSVRIAQVDWAAPELSNSLRIGAPRSIFFDDIYYSGDGPSESEHVFLNGNDLPRRFARIHKTSSTLTIGETGFGTGLNILVAWRAFDAARITGSRAQLNFLSCDLHPLSPRDLEQAHAAWPALADYSARLRENDYPPLAFRVGVKFASADDVALTFVIRRRRPCAPNAPTRRSTHGFLTDFRRSKNPEMWRLGRVRGDGRAIRAGRDGGDLHRRRRRASGIGGGWLRNAKTNRFWPETGNDGGPFRGRG